MINKTFLHKALLILIALFFNYNLKAQQMQNIENIYKDNLTKETWITDFILGLDLETEKYMLTKYVERKFAGNLTSFTDEANYESKYVAPCGNDNFTAVNGKYEFLDENRLKISVDSVSYWGEWDKPNEYRKQNEIIYLITEEGNKIILTKDIE